MSDEPTFRIRPCSADSARLLERGEHVLLGLSPWNGYYRPRTVEALARWASARFTTVDFIVPGDEVALTLTAAGWPRERAARRAHRAVKRLRNPAVRALAHCGTDAPERHVRTWTELAADARYGVLRDEVEHAYRTDPAVRRACRRTAALAVQHAAGGQAPLREQIDHAVGYALAELPVVLDSPALFHVGTSVFVYHRPMDLLAPLLTGEAASLRPAPGQGYCVVTAQQPPVRTSDVSPPSPVLGTPVSPATGAVPP
ncbi:tRNA-dependent cyclodipeptide synthase [Streptomyces albireticuli]|uniref:tRNA-dependent cyclodipeptide synthase n=1 Tax=Streptomyces albireticuli TaxID=1940 RepID=UPI00367A0E9D